jgi:hypothetical protein
VVRSLGAETRRRDFIKVIDGSAITWRLAVRTQQTGSVRRIGVFMPFAADDHVLPDMP